MIKKKAKSRAKAKRKTAAKTARKTAGKKEIDPAQVRREISGMVKSEAAVITETVMDQAKSGQLAPAKYLLEMAGVYPVATDGEPATEEEDSMVKSFLARLEAPPKPPDEEDDEERWRSEEPAGEKRGR
jgi:hypothetical protein